MTGGGNNDKRGLGAVEEGVVDGGDSEGGGSLAVQIKIKTRTMTTIRSSEARITIKLPATSMRITITMVLPLFSEMAASARLRARGSKSVTSMAAASPA